MVIYPCVHMAMWTAVPTVLIRLGFSRAVKVSIADDKLA